tara:strand:+ start:1249 stop:2226 length:978 start_codon:yes stop_codon:yes gene_type:complete
MDYKTRASLNMAEASSIVDCVGVTKRFGTKEALRNFNLNLSRGVCLGLLGPNGAGKTTALKLIYGLIPPTKGAVFVFGENVSESPRRVRGKIGVTLQENALIDELSAVENLEVFGRYHRLGSEDLKARVGELLNLLDLERTADVPVKFLSGGYQRRIAIARSLINEPLLLILDEPTTGLDPAIRRELWDCVRILQESGTTILLTTHYMEEAQRLCDELVVMSRGDIVSSGSSEELIFKHLESQALEIDLADTDAISPAWSRLLSETTHLRQGGQLVLYTPQADELRRRISANHDLGHTVLNFWSRPTNLEDVFLSITGNVLSEGE